MKKRAAMMQKIKKFVSNNNMLSLAATGGGAILGFISFVLLVGNTDKEVFGAWAFYISTATMLDMAKTGFVQTPLVRHLAAAKSSAEQDTIIASGFAASLVLTFLLALIVFTAPLLFPQLLDNKAFSLFFTGYPFYTFASLLHNFSSWVFQAQNRFDKVLAVRLVPRLLFILLLLAAFSQPDAGPMVVLVCHILSLGVASIVAWSVSGIHLHTLVKVSRAATAGLVSFGKYSTGTMIGSNLLRSSDITILGIVLGAEAVAVYHVAQKIVEFVEIPLRALASVAFPRLSRDAVTNLKESVKSILRSYALPLSLLVVPVAIVAFVFADNVVTMLGGNSYGDASLIVQIFAISLFFLPFDRFTGVILDSINRPDLNFYKVMTMLAVNVAGDLLVLRLFGTASSVAAVTIATFITGALWGGILMYNNVFHTSRKNLQPWKNG
ncbi:lipopolysaccharide biosynthesis protein [Prosthecochloris sp. HL-130-GSB]|uniref:lipopolysaccharide biosynthesis protein n=1 Tax=Prosthecochloris sp. HL-130-GSB TaxID=1974213 RepID=UPI0018DEA83F|nr:oligosaccharide flippase family protein [Prosthecochloris sp. HL-130-GSB]